MRPLSLVALAALLLSIACGPGEPSEFCAQALEDNAACLSNDAAEVCAAAEERCPGQVLIAESCPVQFRCP